MKDLKISTLSFNICKILYYYGPKQQRQKYQNSIYRGQSQSHKTHRQRKIDSTNLPLYEEISRNKNLQDAKSVIKGSISKFYFYLKWRKCNIDDSLLLRKSRFCHKLYYFDICCYLKRIRTIVHCVN